MLGTHPHVIEPIEMITDEDTGHEMLVYYSLGNFVNWTATFRRESMELPYTLFQNTHRSLLNKTE